MSYSSVSSLAVHSKLSTVTIRTDWTTNSGYWSQRLTISGATSTSKIDILPSNTLLSQMETDGVTAIRIENNNGTCTVYCREAKTQTNVTANILITGSIGS